MGLPGKVVPLKFLLRISFLVKSKKGWLFLSLFLHIKLPFDVIHLSYTDLN